MPGSAADETDPKWPAGERDNWSLGGRSNLLQPVRALLILDRRDAATPLSRSDLLGLAGYLTLLTSEVMISDLMLCLIFACRP